PESEINARQARMKTQWIDMRDRQKNAERQCKKDASPFVPPPHVGRFEDAVGEQSGRKRSHVARKRKIGEVHPQSRYACRDVPDDGAQCCGAQKHYEETNPATNEEQQAR